MKKACLLCCGILLSIFLCTGCSQKGVSITATIEERWGEDSFLINVEEGTNAITGSVLISAGEEVAFLDKNGEVISADDIQDGDRIRITCDGEVYETSPMIIKNTTEVRLID